MVSFSTSKMKRGSRGYELVTLATRTEGTLASASKKIIVSENGQNSVTPKYSSSSAASQDIHLDVYNKFTSCVSDNFTSCVPDNFTTCVPVTERDQETNVSEMQPKDYADLLPMDLSEILNPLDRSVTDTENNYLLKQNAPDILGNERGVAADIGPNLNISAFDSFNCYTTQIQLSPNVAQKSREKIIVETSSPTVTNPLQILAQAYQSESDNQCCVANSAEENDSDNWSPSKNKRRSVNNCNINDVNKENNYPIQMSTFSSDTTSDENEEIVGKRGLRKNKTVSKKQKRKSEKCTGFGKSVKPNPCTGRKCGNGCGDITEEERLIIHNHYWGMASSTRQRDWLLSCTKEIPIKRKRVENGRRSVSYEYYVRVNENSTKVCQQFLMKTLDVSQMMFRYTKKKSSKMNTSKIDGRGKHMPHNKTSPENLEELRGFIKKLPAVQSHYCRSKSERLYLPVEFKNISRLYEIYKAEIGKNQVSLKVFRTIFNKEFNIGFHLPKKDKCLLCEKVQTLQKNKSKNIQELQLILESEDYINHKADKRACLANFLRDQEDAKKDQNFLCVSFDLQKVLATPHGESVSLYYSRKYAYYNESIYESGTRKGYCYLWEEVEGKRGCNEICTILNKYLTDVDNCNSKKKVALYSDSCAGQNKNRTTLAMLMYFMSKKAKNIEELSINFLLPSHTNMPVDSIHSTIESFIKKRRIWAPSEWPSFIRNARLNPEPYTVIVLKHTDFLDWKTFASAYWPKSIKVKFHDLRKAIFKKNEEKCTIVHGFESNSKKEQIDLTLLIRSRQNRSQCTEPSGIYQAKLPISSPKYKDLARLCEKEIIPKEYRNEYLSMPHCNQNRDALLETDDEEE